MVQQGSPRPKENSKKQGVKVAQVQTTTSEENFQKRKKPIQSNDQILQETQHIHNIKDNHNNPRQLYKIISSLIGQDNTNPLPDAQSSQDLAEQFSEFFLQKIETIWEKFNNIAHTRQNQMIYHNLLNSH